MKSNGTLWLPHVTERQAIISNLMKHIKRSTRNFQIMLTVCRNSGVTLKEYEYYFRKIQYHSLFLIYFSFHFFSRLGLKYLVHLSNSMGLKESQEYANKLKRVEKMQKIRDEVTVSRTV